jgi:hypothetical protein
MKKILSGYVGNYNRRHKRCGHLFQNRYKSIVCEDDPYLLELTRYIHLNPLRARKIFSKLAVKRMGNSGAAVARYLGVTTSAVNRIANSEELPIIQKYSKLL